MVERDEALHSTLLAALRVASFPAPLPGFRTHRLSQLRWE
jgi:hypothetical protein